MDKHITIVNDNLKIKNDNPRTLNIMKKLVSKNKKRYV